MNIRGLIKNLKFSNKFSKSSVPLCYHSIPQDHNDHFDSNIHAIPESIFYRQIVSLKKKYSILSIDEFFEEKKKNRKKITAITFDDGYVDVVKQAVPILESLDVPFTIYITTKVLDGQVIWRDKIRWLIQNHLESGFSQFLKKEQVKIYSLIDWSNFYTATKNKMINSQELESSIDQYLSSSNKILNMKNLYMTEQNLKTLPRNIASIGNHTHNHYFLSSLSESQQYDEINMAKKIINSLDVPVSNTFAVPFGGYHTFDQGTIEIIKSLGYAGLLMTNSQNFGDKINLGVKFHSIGYTNRILPRTNSFIYN